MLDEAPLDEKETADEACIIKENDPSWCPVSPLPGHWEATLRWATCRGLSTPGSPQPSSLPSVSRGSRGQSWESLRSSLTMQPGTTAKVIDFTHWIKKIL